MATYDDIRDKLDQALASPAGTALTFESPGQAHAFRMSAYLLRRWGRRDSRKVYPPNHPDYGHSPYDALTLRIIPPATLMIEPRASLPKAELLPSPDQAPETTVIRPDKDAP